MSTLSTPREPQLSAGPDIARGEETTIREPSHPAVRAAVAWLGGLLSAPAAVGIALHNEQGLATVLGLAIAIAFIAVSWRGRP
jgi:hypothetical protein